LETRTILAIESSVAGGSLAIYRDDRISCSVGNIARVEIILSSIDSLLVEAKLTTRDVELVAVSLGPGSFTGIRIGIATAMGIGAANGTPCLGISTITAVASSEILRDRFGVVPIGRGQFAIQHFQKGNTEPTDAAKVRVLNAVDLSDLIRITSDKVFVFAAESQFSSTEHKSFEFENIVLAGEATAKLMCQLAADGYGNSILEPVYARADHA